MSYSQLVIMGRGHLWSLQGFENVCRSV